MRSVSRNIGIVVALLASSLVASLVSTAVPARAVGSLPAPQLTVGFNASGYVAMSWVAVPGATGYRIGWTADQSLADPAPSTIMSYQSNTLTDLIPVPLSCSTTGCRFWIRTVDAGGDGAWSKTYYLLGDAPSPPRGVVVSGANQTIVSWSPPQNLGSPSLQYYQVEVTYWQPIINNPALSSWNTMLYTALTGTTFDVSASPSPVDCTSKGCSIRVFAVGLTGLVSAPSERRTWNGGRHPAGTPTNLHVTTAGGQNTIAWDSPSDLGQPAATAFVLDMAYWSALYNSWQFTQYTVFGLQFVLEASPAPVDCITHGCIVRVLAVGPGTERGAPSASVTFGPATGVASPGVPQIVTATRSATGELVQVSWMTPVTGGVPLPVYRVTRNDGTNWTADISVNQTYPCPKLDRCGFTVEAMNVGGFGPESSVAYASAPNPPTAAQNHKTTASANGVRQVTWSAPANVGGGALMGYDVLWSVTTPDGLSYRQRYEGRTNAATTSKTFTCPFQAVPVASGSRSNCFDVVGAVNPFGSNLDKINPKSDAATRATAAQYGYYRDGSVAGDPVSLANGNLTGSWGDIQAPPGTWSMDWVRSYNSRDVTVGVLGTGWSTILDARLTAGGGGSYVYRDRDGRTVTFNAAPGGGWVRPEDLDAQLSTNVTGPVLTWLSGEVWQFDTTGILLTQTGWEGQSVTFTWVGGKVTTITSSSGYTLTMTYTGALLTQVASSTAQTIVYVFNGQGISSVSQNGRLMQSIVSDASGRLQQLSDATGVVLMLNTFDTSNRVMSQSSAAGAAVAFSYNTTAPDQDVTTMTDAVTGAVATFTFDKGGRQISAVDPLGAATASQYDIAGNRLAADSRGGESTFATYDSLDRPTQIVTDASGNSSIVYDTAGRVASITNTLGRTTTYTYDGAERLPSSTTFPDGTITTANIVNGLVMSTTDADGVSVAYTYDGQRRPFTVKDAQLHTTTYTYNTRGQVLTVTDPTGAVTTNVYDSFGRLSSVKDALLKTTLFTYDNADRLLTTTDPTGAVTINTYDTAGRLATITDPSNYVTSYGYDTAGRLKTVTRPGAAVTTLSYDLMNRVASVQDPVGRITTYGYDTEGRRTRITGPDGGITDTLFDEAGHAVAVRDPLGRTSQNTFDAFGHLTSVTDPAAQVTSMLYDNRDRVSSVTDARGGVHATTYSLAGRVKTTTSPTLVVMTNMYDNAGRRFQVQGPTGNTTTTFDAASRPLTVTTPGNLVSSVTYDAVGRVLTSTEPTGVVTTNTWSSRGELLTTTKTGAGVTTFVYNPNGTLAQVTDPANGVTTFTYDGRKNRLTRSNGMAGVLKGVDTWTYDLADQMLTSKDPLNRTTNYTYSPRGMIATVTDPSARIMTYTYDQAGQMTLKAATGGSTYQYAYDSLGRRTSVAVGAQTWAATWAPGDLLTAQTDPGGRTTNWQYDTAGRVTGLTYPDGTSLQYGYDTASRLSTIKPGELLADTFTGTTGTVLDAGKWTPTLTSGGTATIQTNTARLAVTATAGSTAAVASTSVAILDSDAVVTYTAGDITPANATDVIISARQSGASEYRVTLPTSSATATVAKKVAGVLTTLGTFAIPGTGTRKVRFQVQGTNLRVRVWQADQTEPVGWTATFTSAAVAVAGKSALAVARTAGTNSVTFDNWTLTNPTTPPATIATYGWNADYQFTSETLNGGSRAWTYTTGRVTNYTQILGATTTSTALTYDTTGRIKTEVTGALTKTFGYDPAGQLKTITPSTGSVTTYNYDAIGRRASVQVGAATTTNTYDLASQLTQSSGTAVTNYTYDPAGRRLTETTGATVTNYTYDPQGRLANTVRGATTVTRGYDPDNNLTTVTNGATVTQIDWDPTTGIPQPTIIGGQRYVRGPDGWLQTRTGAVDTNTGRDIYGSNISPTASARSTGYDPYGKPNSGANTFTPVLGYRGEITIDSLTYLRARNYDATNGVFTTRDPLDGVNGTTVVGNAYHYSANSPLMHSDPSGLSPDYERVIGNIMDNDGNPHRQHGDGSVEWYPGMWISMHAFLVNKAADWAADTGDWQQRGNDQEWLFQQEMRMVDIAGSAAAAIVCGQVGFAAGAACSGIMHRFVQGRANGNGIADSATGAFDPTAITKDAIIGAVIGAVFNRVLGPVLSGIATRIKGTAQAALNDAAIAAEAEAAAAAATNTASGAARTQLFRSVESGELADLVGSGQFRTIAGQEGKYFFPTQQQAAAFDDIISGQAAVTSGRIDSSLLSGVEQITISGEGVAWFIPEELLPYIDNIVIHGAP